MGQTLIPRFIVNILRTLRSTASLRLVGVAIVLVIILGSLVGRHFVQASNDSPVVAWTSVPSVTNQIQLSLTGTVTDANFNSLVVQHHLFGSGTTSTIYTTDTLTPGATSTCLSANYCGTFSVASSLSEGINIFSAIATDDYGMTASTTVQIIADHTAPTGYVDVVSVTSEDQVLVGDQYFVTVSASDGNGSGVSTVHTSSGLALEVIENVPIILIEMYGLDQTSPGTPTTHIDLRTVAAGTPVAVNTLTVTLTDAVGNSREITGSLNVVASRTNRNFYLFPGFNYIGLALVPDDGDASTTNDASLDRLMTQDVNDRVSEAISSEITSAVTLGDIVETTWGYGKGGAFLKHTPGAGSKDTMQVLEPFQGMLMIVKEQVGGATTTTEVFKKVSVAGSTTQQAVPIRINIQGRFFLPGAWLPPSKELRVGYNLIAPHIVSDTTFYRVFLGALIPRELAIAATSFIRRVDASIDSDGITAEIVEGWVSNSQGDLLKPEFSYWTFIVDDPQNNLVNDLGDPLGPTITP